MRLRNDFPAIVAPARGGHEKDADTQLRELRLSLDDRVDGDSARNT